MRVLISGTSGFIGSHLASRLVERKDIDLYSLERYVTARYALGRNREVKTVFGDLKDYHAVKQIIHEVQPDTVIHLAALSAVSYSYDHPHEVFETNFFGTMNLAEACLHEVPHFKHFLFASTSETYGNGPSPKTEETPQYPNSPYAVSKKASEDYLLYMRDAYNFPVTILRNFNSYGRKDNAHFIVERTISQMMKGGTVRLGDPDPVRDLQYVDDHVNSYVTCLDNPNAKGEAFNFCTGRGTSIRQLVTLISELAEFKGEIVWNTIPARPLDIKVLIGDYGKAEHLLGWEPKTSLEQGLEKTISYWRSKL